MLEDMTIENHYRAGLENLLSNSLSYRNGCKPRIGLYRLYLPWNFWLALVLALKNDYVQFGIQLIQLTPHRKLSDGHHFLDERSYML